MHSCGSQFLEATGTSPRSASGGLFQRLQHYASDIPHGIRPAQRRLSEWPRSETPARVIQYLVSGVVLPGINSKTQRGDFVLCTSVSACVNTGYSYYLPHTVVVTMG